MGNNNSKEQKESSEEENSSQSSDEEQDNEELKNGDSDSKSDDSDRKSETSKSKKRSEKSEEQNEKIKRSYPYRGNPAVYDSNSEKNIFVDLSEVEGGGSQNEEGYYGFYADRLPSNSKNVSDMNSKYTGDRLLDKNKRFSKESDQVKS